MTASHPVVTAATDKVIQGSRIDRDGSRSRSKASEKAWMLQAFGIHRPIRARPSGINLAGTMLPPTAELIRIAKVEIVCA